MDLIQIIVNIIFYVYWTIRLFGLDVAHYSAKLNVWEHHPLLITVNFHSILIFVLEYLKLALLRS